jgi:N-acetylmuramoyl-L-alanine amidase
MFSAAVVSTVLACAALPAAAARPTTEPSVVSIGNRCYYSVRELSARGLAQLSVDERSGRFTVDFRGRRAVLAPAFSVAAVDGRTVDLPYPLAFVGGDTLVPIAVLAGPVRNNAPEPGPAALALRHVVIDPGHGGRDTGAIGPGGLCEKDVTLAVALELQRQMQKRGVRVTMTRSDDRFLSLAERSRLANAAGVDLFLSIHCNASPGGDATGLETFALSPAVTDSYRAGVAASRLNPSDLFEGASARVSPGAEKAVFRAHLDEQRRQSLALARSLQEELVRNLGELDRGVKLRNFSVLRETYVPAALVEVGFISHRGTEARMRKPTHRDQIAGALCRGLEAFSREESRTAGTAGTGTEERVRLADRAR